MSDLTSSLLKQYRAHCDALPGATQTRVAEQRERALAQFEKKGIPSLRLEDWKYTDLRTLRDADYSAFENTAALDAENLDLSALPLPQFTAHVAVFLDGQFSPQLSTLDELPQTVKAQAIAELLEQESEEIVPRLGDHEAAFAALNSAFLRDGLHLSVAPGTVLEQAIHVIFVNSNSVAPRLNSARLIIDAKQDSRCTIVETHYSLDGTECITNALTEITAIDGAVIEHYRIQLDQPTTNHIGNVFATVGKDATVETYSFAFGGAITRIDVNADLVAAGSHVVMNGLFMVNDGQHIDHHTRVRHRVGHTTSSENYKGIADGSGRGVFNGKILVEQDAQKIEALQSSKNLLLSDKAEIDTKPELEIYADDVKCAHGATVGQLDEDGYFYLRSRGIDAQTARGILTFAFAADIAENVSIAPLRAWLEELIVTRTHTTGVNEIDTDV